MNNMRKLINLSKRCLLFESVNDRYQLLPYDYDIDYEGDFDIELDSDEVADRAEQIAKDGGVTILSDKELHSVLVDTPTTRVIGALWVSHDNHKYSFDMAIDSGYQNMGLSSHLIQAAISEYRDQQDAYGDELEMEVDVINPKLAQILAKKYGFSVVGHIDQNRVLMSL